MEIYIGIAVILAFVGCLALVVLQRMHMRSLTERLHAQETQRTKLQEEMTVLLDCTKGIGDRLQKQQSQLQDLQELSKQRVTAYSAKSSRYQQAQELLRTGSSVTEIMSTCGISRADAELLQRSIALRTAMPRSKEPKPQPPQQREEQVSAATLIHDPQPSPQPATERRPPTTYKVQSRRVSEPPRTTFPPLE